MKALRVLSSLQALRAEPLWALLAAEKAPVILALLGTLFESDRRLPASVLADRLAPEVAELRKRGLEVRSAQHCIDDWRGAGWLMRTLPPGATEEMYELTIDAAAAWRYVNSLATPRSRATESRLAIVIDSVIKLADDTDPNAASRLRAIAAQRQQLDELEASIIANRAKVLDDDRALERIQAILQLAEELADDFRRVGGEFEKVNATLRKRLLDPEGHRGEVLTQFFADIDVIGQTEAGRSFDAFWKLLTDGEQSRRLEEALETMLGRTFSSRLSVRDRQFLFLLTRTLLREGDAVHEVMRTLSRNLKSFVQSREYLEHRRLSQLIATAQHAALALKDDIPPNKKIGLALRLTSSPIDSVARRILHDPQQRNTLITMEDGDASDLTLDQLAGQIELSDIDFRSLRANIASALESREQIAIPDLLVAFGARQGFGTVVGYVALGAAIGMIEPEREHKVAWVGTDHIPRRARIPEIFFFRGCLDEH